MDISFQLSGIDAQAGSAQLGETAGFSAEGQESIDCSEFAAKLEDAVQGLDAEFEDEKIVPVTDENEVFVDVDSVLEKIKSKKNFSAEGESDGKKVSADEKKPFDKHKAESEVSLFESSPFGRFAFDSESGAITISEGDVAASEADFGASFDAGFSAKFENLPEADFQLEADGAEQAEIGEAARGSFADRIFVLDERTQKPQESREAKSERDVFKKQIQVDENGNARMTLTLAENAKSEAPQTQAIPAEKNFSTLLSNQIRNDADSFVQAGLISLKDGNSGKIDLILRPENLGNVKISLNLSDKLLTGKIVVATEAAYNAFRENQDSLREAFCAKGFDAQNFDISWAGSAQADGQNRGGNERHSAKPGLFYAANAVFFGGDSFEGRAARAMVSMHLGTRLDRLA